MTDTTTTPLPRPAAVPVHHSPHLARFSPLIDGWCRSLYDLPKAVESGLYGLSDLSAQIAQVATITADDIDRQWNTAAVAAALAGQPLPDVADLADKRAEAERSARDRTILGSAMTGVATAVAELVVRHAEAVYDGHLHPALSELFSEVSEISETLGQLRTAEAVLRGTDEQRAAWVRLPSLARRYDMLRRAAGCIDTVNGYSSLGLSKQLPATATDASLLDIAMPSKIDDGSVIVA